MKKVIITGTSRGIGFELAQQFAKNNFQVLALSRNSIPLENLKLNNTTFKILELYYRAFEESISTVLKAKNPKKFLLFTESLVFLSQKHDKIIDDLGKDSIEASQILNEYLDIRLKLRIELEVDFPDISGEEIEKKITPKTKIISITHLSNVTGAILPIKEITELAHSKNIIVVVDGCQGAPHLRLDMQDLDCDFYAISCHKMYGPTGLGVLYGKKKWLEELPPYQGGGGMINEVKKDRISYGELPNKYEAGTMATAQVIAFDQSIKFLESVGIENVMKHEAELVEYGQELLQKNNSVKLIGNPKNKGGVLSFTIEGIHPHDVATILDEDGVAIRAGHHCCQILHDKLNIPASSRASVGIYNTREDLDKLNDAINNCKKIFNQK